MNRPCFLLFVVALIPSFSFGQGFDYFQKVVADDREEIDRFAENGVSIDSNWAVVGARYEDHNLDGTDYQNSAGAVYVFHRKEDGYWEQHQKIIASDRTANDLFGTDVDIFDDRIVIGSMNEDEDAGGANYLLNAGSAYVFKRDIDSVWVFEQKLVAADREQEDTFGFSVGIYDSVIVVGALAEDHDEAGGAFIEDAGSAYVFRLDDGGSWNQLNKLVAPDRSGSDLMAYDVSLWDRTIVISSGNGYDVDGTDLLFGTGSAYIFEENTDDSWSFTQKIVASDRTSFDGFGDRVCVWHKSMIVGAWQEDENEIGLDSLANAGAAYFFEYNNSTGLWEETQKVVPTVRAAQDRFGSEVAIYGDYALVSSPGEDEDELEGSFVESAGAAYLYERDGAGVWNEVQKWVDPYRNSNEKLGRRMDLGANEAIVGVNEDKYDENEENGLDAAGAAFLWQTVPFVDEPDDDDDSTITTGIKMEEKRTFRLFPNPSKGVVHLSVSQAISADLRLFTLRSELVWTGKLIDEQEKTLDLGELPQGMYLLEVRSASDKKMIRLSVVH